MYVLYYADYDGCILYGVYTTEAEAEHWRSELGKLLGIKERSLMIEGFEIGAKPRELS